MPLADLRLRIAKELHEGIEVSDLECSPSPVKGHFPECDAYVFQGLLDVEGVSSASVLCCLRGPKGHASLSRYQQHTVNSSEGGAAAECAVEGSLPDLGITQKSVVNLLCRCLPVLWSFPR